MSSECFVSTDCTSTQGGLLFGSTGDDLKLGVPPIAAGADECGAGRMIVATMLLTSLSPPPTQPIETLVLGRSRVRSAILHSSTLAARGRRRAFVIEHA